MSEDTKHCVVKPGESVIVIDRGYLLPDGTTSSSIANCDFQDGSSIAFSYQKDPPKVENPVEVTTSSAVTETDQPDEVTTVATVAVEATTPLSPVVSEPTLDVSTGLVIAAATVATAAAVSAASASMRKGNSRKKPKETKSNKSQKQQEREKEEQEKCSTASDVVSDKINAVLASADASHIHRVSIKEPKSLYADIEELQQEVSILTKVLKKKRKDRDS